MEFNAYMNQQKRIFVNNKYHLPFFDYEANYVANYSVKRYSSSTTNNAPCVNEDFEANNFTGWAISEGTTNAIASGTLVYGACIDNPCPTSISTGSLASIVSTPFLDPLINISIPNSPLGGTKIAKINTNTTTVNSSFIFKAVKLTQNFPVTANNSLFDFAYFAVMDATSPHLCCEQPYMYVKMRDCFGNLLTTCPVFSITVPGTTCPGTGPTSWTTTSGIARSNGWQQYSIDLANYIGCNITIEVTVGHCQYGGHFAYAYFDSECNQMNFNVSGNTVTAPSTSPVSASVACASTATLIAPAGLGPYLWNGPIGSGISSNTSQTITTTVPGSYSISMSPVGICNPINRVISLSFPPPTTVTASPANLCATGTNTISTLSAFGATSYTWLPSGSTLSSIAVSPTVTTIYTVTAKTGTCVGTYTVQVIVNPDPIFNVVSSNSSLCPGQTATLTALGASSNTYGWNPGSLTGSVVTISQIVATTYTTVATSTAGCTSTVTTPIGMNASPNVVITAFSPTFVCSGSPVTLVATGASIVWQPGGSTSGIEVFTPTVTTTYTAFGSSGSCTSSATKLIQVDQGPPITISSNPTITCPGNTTTLSAVAPAAVGAFTWMPGPVNASSIVVTPTISGGYSVSATNTMGCINTQTINPNINALPNIAISPTSPSVCAGSSIILTASGGNTYTWLPTGGNAANASFTPSSTSTYTVLGANAAGCVSQATVTITVVSPPVISASASPTAICPGSCANITPSGASVYTVTPGGSMIVCPIITTVYSIVGTNGTGCLSSPVTVTVTVNPTPNISASANPAIICSGNSSTLTAIGGVTYTWSSPPGGNSATVVVTPTVTQTYTVNGSNAFGCSGAATVVVNVTPPPLIVINPSAATVCPSGTVAVSATGATSYTWSPGGLTGANVVLAPPATTTYTVLGSNGSCTGQNTIVVTVAPAPVITASFNPGTVCAGSCATLAASGTPTAYFMTGLSAIACPTVSSPFTVYGVDVNGCRSNTVSGTLFVNSAPVILASSNPASICPGDSSFVSATGGTSYTWQPGNIVATGFYAKPASSTIYTATSINGSGCAGTATTQLLVNPAPVISITPSSTTICQNSTVTLVANGATSYTWLPINLTGSNVSVSPTITTTYTVIGSNGSCNGMNTVVVTVNPIPVINATFNPTTVCAGSCATLNPTGAVTYSTFGMAGTVACPTITSTYTVIGTSGGCNSAPFIISLPVISLPTILASANPTLICPGDSSFVSATGGTSYTWQPGGIVASGFYAKPAISTNYTVTGKNGVGCSNTANTSVFVTVMAPMFANATPTSICSGGNATLSATGAAGGYFWMPGALSGQNVFVTPSITTTYVVTGTTGVCTATASVVVAVNPTPIVTITSSTTSICAGGSVVLSLIGASTYSWSDGSTAVSRTVSPGVTTTYAVIGFGSTGCISNIASITITVNSTPLMTVSASPATVCAGSSATLTAGGAVTNNWLPGNLPGSTIIVTPSLTSTYQVTGTSAAGCTANITITVNVTPAIVLSASASPSTICAGGVVNLTASGATNYGWGPGSLPASANITVSPSSNTIYTVTGTTNGCVAQKTVAVNVISAPSVSISTTSSSICAGNCVTLTASGASSYTWSNLSTGPSVVVCPTITNTYTVIGSNGSCFGSATIPITVGNVPVLNIAASANTICTGSSVSLTGGGATTYSWSTGSTSQNISVSPPTTTVYTLYGFNGTCSTSINYTVTVISGGTINITASSPSICAGYTVGLLATGAPNFTWQPNGTVINPLIDTPLTTTTYTAFANNSGCASNATITIVVVPLPVITLTANPQTICAGNTTTLTAGGGVTYSWVPSLVGGSTFTANPTVNTSYTVVGFAANGCPNYATTNVSVVPAPSIVASSTSPSVCLGSSTTLSATGASNYTWQPVSQNGSVIIVSPIVATTYTVYGDNGGCIGSTTISIGINPLPTIFVSATSTSICPNDSVVLSASGAVIYSWTPPGLTGANITVFPAASTNYTVTGVDANGCVNTGNIFIFVNPMANITAVAHPSNVCQGGTVALVGGGGLTYTWNPGAQVNNPVTVTPSVSTVYTLMASDASGCTGSFTVPVIVTPNPTITISPVNYSVCLGSSATLTAFGATSYTWLPSNTNSSVTIETPVAFTTYTVLGDNAGICFSSATVNVYVNQLPKNVTASNVGTVSCSSPTAQLLGTCSNTNISWFWTGPQGYTATVQNPVISGIWGTFTLNVIDNTTGCVASATTDVPTDNSIPLVNPVTSGSITCAVSTVTLNAVNTTTNPGYHWTGPAGFTSTVQTPTVSVQGTYTITVTDLSSTCSASAIVTVGTHTNVSITASITPATCNGSGGSNNDGAIGVAGFALTDRYDLVSGVTYTGSATYTNAANIPGNGVITANLANPSTTLAYTIRLFDGEGCKKDTTLFLIPVDCSLRTLGIAKAVSASTLNTDGSYDLTYRVVVKNYDVAGALNNIALTENLSNTFPSNTTFTVVNTPAVDPPSSGLTMNSMFDGSTQTNLLSGTSNTLAGGKADTITFTLKVKTSLFFVAFKIQ